MAMDKSYISRVFNNEKPLTLAFEVALPEDVQALYKQYRAESFGLVVIEQMDEETARRQFAAGLFSLFSRPSLPLRSGGQVKAGLHSEQKARTA